MLQGALLVVHAWLAPGGTCPSHGIIRTRQHPFLAAAYDPIPESAGERAVNDLTTLHLQLHMAGGDREGVIAACLQLGDAAAGGDGRLWEEALQWFGRLDADCSTEVRALDSPLPGCHTGLCCVAS